MRPNALGVLGRQLPRSGILTEGERAGWRIAVGPFELVESPLLQTICRDVPALRIGIDNPQE
jgi:hypothetical protein